MSDPMDGFFSVLDSYIQRAVAPLRETIARQADDLDRLRADGLDNAGLVMRIAALEDREPIAGKDGAPGAPGIPGTKGDAGPAGMQGKDGTAIVDAAIDVEGVLMLTLSDGTTRRAGRVCGRDGAPGANGKDGTNGKDGKDGVSVDHAELCAMVDAAVKAIPTPKDGRDGTSVEPELVRSMVADAVKAIPIPRDGKDGKDGASVDVEQVRTMIAAEVKSLPPAKDGRDGKDGTDGVSVVEALTDDAGVLMLTMSNGTTKRIGKVRGTDGRDGINGKDGAPGADGKDGRDGVNGKDGTSVDPESVRALVADAVKAIPPAKDGVDGKDGRDGVDGKDGAPGAAGRDGIDGKDGAPGIAGTAGRDGIDGKDGAPGLAGKDGRDGVDGKDGAAGINGKDGRDGIDGKDGASAIEIARAHGFAGSDLDWLASLRGKDGEDGVSILSAVVDGEGELVLTASDGVRHRAGVVKGRDGDDGMPGLDGDEGAPGRDAVAIRPIPMIEDAKTYPPGSWAVHGGGSWYAEKATEPLRGRWPQEAGWTPLAIGEAKCDVGLADDLRTVIIKRTTSTGFTLERRIRMPVIIDRGVFASAKEYERGDAVTSSGSYFVAKVDKPTGKPGASDDWRMLIKGAKQ